MRITLRRMDRSTKFKVFWDAHGWEILLNTNFFKFKYLNFTPKKRNLKFLPCFVSCHFQYVVANVILYSKSLGSAQTIKLWPRTSSHCVGQPHAKKIDHVGMPNRRRTSPQTSALAVRHITIQRGSVRCGYVPRAFKLRFLRVKFKFF